MTKNSPHHQRHPPDSLAIDQNPAALRIIFQRQTMRNVRPDFSGFRPLRERLDPHFAERRSSPHRLAGADAEHARPLDQQEIGAGEPNATGEADDEDAGAPGDAAQAVFENLAADGIEHHIRAAAIGDALDGVAERLPSLQYQEISAPRLRAGPP